MPSKNTLMLLWILSIVGALCVLPYLHYTGMLPPTFSLPVMALILVGQTALLSGLAVWLAGRFLEQTDLRPFNPISPLSLALGASWGVIVGGILVVLSMTLFKESALNNASGGFMLPPLWTAALASVYGAINEEVMLRLFLLTLIYFGLNRFLGQKMGRTALLMTAIIVSSLLFGVGHLPAAYRLITPDAYEITRILVLNGVAGIAFGTLYCTQGFWVAALAHFVADLVVHVGSRMI